MTEKLPQHVGVGAVIIHKHHVLLGKRKGIYGDGQWAAPGGHVDPGESLEKAIDRELMEEAGIELEPIEFLHSRYETHDDGTGYLMVWFVSGPKFRPEVKNMEPDKCSEWKWFHIDELPDSLFGTTSQAVNQSIGLYLNGLI